MNTARIERSQVQYRGRFAEPVFSVLGNPASLYASLLRHLRQFGASVGGLSINVDVLAEANVACLLSMGIVRVRLDHVEVFLKEVPSETQIKGILAATFAAMSDTHESLHPIRHEATFAMWATIDEGFSTYIRKLITVPSGFVRAKPSVDIVEFGDSGEPVGSVRMEEATGIPDGLYLRSSIELGAAAADANQLYSMFRTKMLAQLKALGLDFGPSVS
jgi:hypothetical protein